MSSSKGALRHARGLCFVVILAFSFHVGSEEASRSQAPSIVHHLQHYTQNLWPITQGVEIEGLMPHSTPMADVVQYVKTALQQQYKNIEFLQDINTLHGDLKIRFKKNTRFHEEHTYALKREVSQYAPQGFYAFELSSSILKNKKDFKVFLSIFKTLKQAGFIANPVGGGTHVHIGFPQPQAHELALLICTFAAVEKAVYKNFGFIYTRYFHAVWIRKFQQACFHNFIAQDQVVELFTQGQRRWALNFESLKHLETVEFRFANSTNSPRYVEDFLQLATSLVQAVRSKQPEFIQFLYQNKNIITKALVEGSHQDYLFSELTKALKLIVPVSSVKMVQTAS